MFLLNISLIFSLKGYTEKAIEIALKKISQLEETFKFIPNDLVQSKILELKMISNGDLKNCINSFYLFSLGKKNETKIFQANNSKKRTKIERKALKAESKISKL